MNAGITVFGIIIIILGVGFLVVMALILFTILRLFRGRRRSSFDADETRMMQEIHQGLEKMEKRVDTLETLLLEQERKDKL